MSIIIINALIFLFEAEAEMSV